VTTYRLYLDHGPKRRKTMVHVIDLMGCIANGPTTDEALDHTPEAIRNYARFLADHGESVDRDEPFGVRIAEEVTEGKWLGNGVAVFGPDRDPLRPREVGPLLARYGWIRGGTLALVEDLTAKERSRKPPTARAIEGILVHVLGADAGYLASGLGSNRDLNRLARQAEAGELDVREALAEGARLFDAGMRSATPAQRTAVIPRGQSIGSARRTIRRALEHGWEHLLEIRARLADGPD
jgi:predicted RNase H-like HicB family nuclease/uncharacterized damage-inducible protein DinB